MRPFRTVTKALQSCFARQSELDGVVPQESYVEFFHESTHEQGMGTANESVGKTRQLEPLHLRLRVGTAPEIVRACMGGTGY